MGRSLIISTSLSPAIEGTMNTCIGLNWKPHLILQTAASGGQKSRILSMPEVRVIYEEVGGNSR